MMARKHALMGTLLLLGAIACGKAGSSPPADPPTSGAVHVPLAAPEDVVYDASGNLYVSEFDGNRIDRIAPDGHLEVIAGTGVAGYSGDGGPATAAKLNAPTGILFDAKGNLVIADHHNGCIRTIDGSGTISTLFGRCGHVGFSGDGGPARSARLDDPIGIALDPTGRLFIADEQNARIREVNTEGMIRTVAGGGGRSVADAPDGIDATQLRLSHPSYLALDDDGNLYFSDFWANVVMRIDAQGRAWHVAGTGEPAVSGDGGPATKAALDFPTGLAIGPDGVLYVSGTSYKDPNADNVIRAIDPMGTITTVVGSGEGGHDGDGGPATQATILGPSGLSIGPAGALVIADQGNDLVRSVDQTGTIGTVAG